MAAAENGCKQKWNHFMNNGVATRLAHTCLDCLGRAAYYHSVCGGRNRLAASLFEYRIVLFIPKDGIDAKTECRQITAVCWSKCVDRVRFNAHWLPVDRLVLQKRRYEFVRAQFTVELWIERIGMAQD